MFDLIEEMETLHRAVAEARIVVTQLDLGGWLRGSEARERVLPEARAAALLSAKRAHELLPRLPSAQLDRVELGVEVTEEGLRLRVEVAGFGRVSLEAHAVTAASVAAAAIYVRLRELDGEARIDRIELSRLRRGDRIAERSKRPLGAELIVVSAPILAAQKEDRLTPAVLKVLAGSGAELEEAEVLPEEEEAVRARLALALDRETPLILLAGGTGLLPGERTPELLRALAQERGGREIPGVAEAMRAYGQRRNVRAGLSRTSAVVFNKSVVLTLPGSSSGARESLIAALPVVLHLLRKLRAADL